MLTLAAAGAVLPGCSAKIEGNLYQNGSAELRVEAALEPQMISLLRRFQALGGASAAGNTPVLDGPAMAQSMTAAPGIASVSFHNTGPAAIAGTIGIFRVDDFLSQPNQAGGSSFITYDPAGMLRLSLDRRSAPQVFKLFSPELKDYLTNLMAPAADVEFQKEIHTKKEYLEMLGFIYPAGLVQEIAAARISALLDFPGPVTGVQGGGAQGRQARFSIPLIDVLVLETPLVYEVRWR